MPAKPLLKLVTTHADFDKGCAHPTSQKALDFFSGMTPTATNRIVSFDENQIAAIGSAVIVKETDLFCETGITAGGIIIPEENVGKTKKYNTGIVISRGKKVEEIQIGDVIVYQTATSAGVDPIPNGAKNPVLFKVAENSIAIICRIPADKVAEEQERRAKVKEEIKAA